MIESGELIENQDGTSAFRPTLISTLDAFPDASAAPPALHPARRGRPTQRRPKR